MDSKEGSLVKCRANKFGEVEYETVSLSRKMYFAKGCGLPSGLLFVPLIYCSHMRTLPGLSTCPV
jgi:hypothetical protein